mgnify:FL=1
MFKLTKAGMLYILTSIIFIIFQIFFNQNPIDVNLNTNIMEQQITDLEAEDKEENLEESKKNENWKIEIPKISLNAEIAEGTTKETLNQYIGHFENTKKKEGNIGLAAHNRGYKVNYFQDLKLLEKGDEIKYTYDDFEKIYEVEKIRIIKDTDWEYLENTEDNRLTLITCVENQPEYRRCVQAVEKEEVRDWKKL